MTRSKALNAVLGILESVSSSGHVLRLVLEQATDRVAHRIEVLDSDSHVLAELRSIEGTSAEDWPPSPPLQSCSLQEIRPGQTAAFLVGMAGKTHWSASIEAAPREGALVFDFACRVQSKPQGLGTSYAMHSASSEAVAHFQLSPAGIAVHVIRTDVGNHHADSFQASEQPLCLVCPDAPPAKFPATMRWRYRIYLTETPDR